MTTPPTDANLKPGPKRRIWPLVLVALVAAAGGVAYAFREEIGTRFAAYQAARAAPVAETPQQPKAPSITVATARTREIAQTLVVTGTLMPRDEIMVGPQIDGLRLDAYFVDIGDRVEKGAILARLDRDMLETQLAQNASRIARAEAAIAQVTASITEAEASRAEADAALERTQVLRKTGNATEETLIARQTATRVAAARIRAQTANLKVAESDKTLAEAERREIELRLARTEVRAPASGYVASRTARVGQIVGMAGEPLFRLVRDGEVELEAEVTETRLHSVRDGQSARVEVAGFPQAVEGRVRLVAPTVDAATRLGAVKIVLPGDTRLRPGLFARAIVETARRDGVVVPQSAVLFGASGPRVQVVVDGVVAERAVTAGLQDADGVEIVNGLADGDVVVARAGGFLRAGDRISPVEAEARSAEASTGSERR